MSSSGDLANSGSLPRLLPADNTFEQYLGFRWMMSTGQWSVTTRTLFTKSNHKIVNASAYIEPTSDPVRESSGRPEITR